MDKAARESLDLPAFEENTWRAGLKRLLLGYALPGLEVTGKFETGNDFLFEGILPYTEIEGSDTLILGKLVEFIEQLFECVQALDQARPLLEWATFLTHVLERFFSPTEAAQEQVQQMFVMVY